VTRSYLAVEAALAKSRQCDWPVVPFKRISTHEKESNALSDQPLLSLSSNGDIGQRGGNDGLGRQAPSEKTIYDYWKVKPDRVVVNPMWLVGGSVGVSQTWGAVSPAYRVYGLRAGVHPRFIHHVLRSYPYLEQYRLLGRGDTTFDRSVGREDFEGLPLRLPPLSDQQRIAEYLDDQVALLERAVELRQEQIALLAERLDAFTDAALWGDGDVSQHVRLGYLTEVVTSGPRGWGDYVGEAGRPFFRSANLDKDSLEPKLANLAFVAPPASSEAEATRAAIALDDVLVGITGANAGWIALVRQPQLVGAVVSQHVALVRPSRAHLDSLWLAHLLRSRGCSRQLMAMQYGGTKTQLSLPNLRDLRVPARSTHEQRATGSLIEQEASTMATYRVLALRQVALLQEKKQALITAAVTGEFDVATARKVSVDV
jgi:type I restriction enzyme, S subunit